MSNEGPNLTPLGKVVVFLFVLGCFYGAYYLFLQPVPQPNSPTKNTTIPQPTSPVTLPTGGIALNIASSSTKQKWMEQVASRFMATGKTVSNGSKIAVKVSAVSSGGSLDAILEGKLQPVVWSPGTDSWVEQLIQRWGQGKGGTLMSKACQPAIYSPLGIAMWRPMAEALGWPDKPIGWKTLVELAADPNGWARYGHPEWGKFRLGHAHPKYANSGLLTVTSFVYGIVGKTDNLTPAEIYNPKVETALRALAQNTSKYGMVTEDLLNLMARQGPSYLHAIATYESDTIILNLERSRELRFPLAFIFPSEGTFWGDHPYCVLDKANWVTPEQAEAAHLFYEFLLKTEQQTSAIDSALRPLDSKIMVRAPLDLANGTDPRITPDKVPPQASPKAELSAAIIDLFTITKRKATVLLVLDVSGSMQGEKIRTATVATASFLRRLDPDDVVGVLAFNEAVTKVVEPAQVSQIVETAANKVNNLIASGSTALHEAVCQATDLVSKLRANDIAAGKNRLYGIVLLSDGANTSSRPTENQMFATCLPAQVEAEGTKIFPIAFGNDANVGLLKRIAEVTGSSLFSATPESIDKIYLKISAEQ